jgi:chromate reductase
VRILAISGSLRAESHNSALLRAAAALAPGGAEVVPWDGLAEIPPFDQDLEQDRPAAVRRLCEALLDADAVLFATPEYNSSIPGQLKNALDWVSRPLADSPLRGRTAAVVSASTGQYGGLWAQQELRKVLRAMGARVLEQGVAVPAAAEAFDETGEVRSPELRARIRTLLEELVHEAAPVRAAA